MSDLLTAVSVLLVFLPILLSLIEKDITNILEEKAPEPSSPIERRHYQKRLKKILFLESLPVTLGLLAVAYTLLPLTIRICSTHQISLWKFDALYTLTFFIEVGLVSFTAYSVKKLVHLISRLRELR